MKTKILLFVLLLFAQSACAQTITQQDMDGVRFSYEQALKVIQGEVMAGNVSPELTGTDFVDTALANHPAERKHLGGYRVKAEVVPAAQEGRVVLLLCDKRGEAALLEGVLCKGRTIVLEPWKQTLPVPCVFKMNVRETCD